MSVDDLLTELSKLGRADKLRAMHLLAAELAAETPAQLPTDSEYEVWSPYDSPDAARILTELLAQEKNGRNDRPA
jgi:hypothetical protein